METVETAHSEARHEMQEKPSRLCYQPSKLPSFLRELSFSDKSENIYAFSLFSLFIEYNESWRRCIAPGYVFLVILLGCGLMFRNTGVIKGLEIKCEKFNSCCRLHPQSELICCVNLCVGDLTYIINEQYEEVE